jgi:hypothetical protein
MATSLAQICEFLTAEGLPYRVVDNKILTGFRTSEYRDTEGDNTLSLMIVLEGLQHDGEFLRVTAPKVYSYTGGPHKAAFFQLLLMISWETRMVQYEYDVRDGEVTATVELAIADSTLTRRQLIFCIHCLARVTEENHQAITAAMTTGEIPKRDHGLETAAMMAEFLEFLEEKRKRERQRSEGNQDLPQ